MSNWLENPIGMGNMDFFHILVLFVEKMVSSVTGTYGMNLILFVVERTCLELSNDMSRICLGPLEKFVRLCKKLATPNALSG